ncbi:MAG: oligosaccharide flippase family protein [Povalibacter sp.]
MAGFARRSALISVTRLLNQGLMLLSPVVLVRLLTVEEFGRYREFLLYAGLLTTICAFGINNSLLYFIPARPESVRQMLRQSVVLTFICSALVVGVAVIANIITHGAVLGNMAFAVAVYVMLFVNFDFWEFYWLAGKQTLPVLAYTSGRLVARMVVVIVAASISSDVQIIVWSLIALESIRFIGSFVAWQARKGVGSEASFWREQIKYCLPVGIGLVLVTLNKSLGNLFVAKAMGAVALAHYSIGTQVQPIITVLRNSLSDAILPEMAAVSQPQDALRLWHRSTVMSMLLLLPAAIILFEFAQPLVVTLFSPEYAPAIPIFQLYLLVLLREVFDFGVALRAVNRNTSIVYSNLIAIVLNIGLLAIAVPYMGLIGAAAAFVVSRYLEGIYLGWRTARAYGAGVRSIANWSDLTRVAIAGTLASIVFYGSFWTNYFGLFGVCLGACAYMIVFVLLLWLLRVPEITQLLQRVEGKWIAA